MAASHRKMQPHALLIPYPLQGHITPAAHLAVKLAARGFTVTFVNTEAIHHCSSRVAGNNAFFPAAAAGSGLDIRYELVSDGLPVDFDRSLHHDQFMFALLHVLSAHVEQLLRRFTLRGDPPLTCLVADTFFVWPSTMAKKFNLPYVSFWTEPALVFSLYTHIDLLVKNGHFASPRGNKKETVTYIPGVPAIEPTDLTSYLQAEETSTVVHQIIFKAFEEAKAADFVLCNTVEELEPETIAALRREKPTFYAIGPIFRFVVEAPTTSLWAEVDCSRWLDSRPAGSVLYISFGSYAHIGKRELAEIAHGLLLSATEVGFLWVLRQDVVSAEDPEALPEGFGEQSRGRGMVVRWCQQTEVLGHRAVGGFLTHCGWNSILESVWCEVPMLCFPLLTDQFTNRKLVVDDWRVGMDLAGGSIGGGGRRKEVSREEVAMRIGRLMMDGDEIRKNVRGIKKTLEYAVGDGGSSEKNFDTFIQDVRDYTAAN